MKARLPLRAFSAPRVPFAWAGGLCQLAETAISPVGTGSLLLGALAAASDRPGIANFLIAAGLLMHFSVWFERWWGSNGRN